IDPPLTCFTGRGVQEAEQPAAKRFTARSQSLALPHGHHVPTEFPKRSPATLIPSCVSLQFRNPIRTVRGRDSASSTAVHVPETTAYVDDFTQSRKYEVRSAWKGSYM